MKSRVVVRYWLRGIVAWLVLTIALGGATRLLGAGLSIVEWKPLAGIFPPLDPAAWIQEFNNYQAYPDFKSNPQMSLEDFKFIFWWEYGHRLVARSLALGVLLPFAVFWWRGLLTKKDLRRVFILLVLGFIQGALGWFMVKSGLVQVPRVSPLRLMVHFLWACLILAYLADWLRAETPHRRDVGGRGKNLFLQGLSILCFVQLALGALVAGSRAGFIFNTFPKMGALWGPENFFLSASWTETLFYNQINLQFFHRLGAWLLAVATLVGWRWSGFGLVALVVGQFILGVLTLLWRVPLPVAVLHQIFGVLLFFKIRYEASGFKTGPFDC